MKKIISIFFVMGFLFFSLVNTSADESIFFKSDSSWKVLDRLEDGWFMTDFVDTHWDFSIGNWKNNPCSYYCGNLRSCELSCSEWMWHSSSCSNCIKYFRKEILIPEEATYGRISISADDSYELYLNGKKVGKDLRDVSYQTYTTYNIPKEDLHTGKNVIAIKAFNKEGYEGVLIMGEFRYKDVSQIKEMKSKIEILNSQIDALTQDKKRLESQVDELQPQVNTLTSEKEELNKQVNTLNLENIQLKDKAERERKDFETKIFQQRIFLSIIILALVIISLFCYSFYQENKKLKEKRKPTLTTVPLERKKTEFKKSPPLEIISKFPGSTGEEEKKSEKKPSLASLAKTAPPPLKTTTPTETFKKPESSLESVKVEEEEKKKE